MPGQQFQTSFIPKKPLVTENPGTPTREPVSIFLILSILVFLCAVGSVAGVYVWEKTVRAQQESYKQVLAENRKSFGEEQLELFQRLNTKINLAQDYLKNHLTPRALFNILSAVTLENIRYTGFNFTPPEKKGDPILITMSGQGASFQAVAYQSDVLGRQAGIKNPILADFAVDDKGFVSFSFAGQIDSSDILYRSRFGASDAQNSNSVQTNSPTTNNSAPNMPATTTSMAPRVQSGSQAGSQTGASSQNSLESDINKLESLNL